MAKRVGLLTPTTPEQIALVAFMAGALYALHRSLQLRFDDSRMTPDLAKTPAELQEVLRAVGATAPVSEAWLSGFYVDSAMMRLSALDERLSKHLGTKRILSPLVPDAVNSMKHDVDAGIGAGWPVRLADTLFAAEQLCECLQRAVP